MCKCPKKLQIFQKIYKEVLNLQNKSWDYLKIIFSKKHVLVCFQLWPIIGDETCSLLAPKMGHVGHIWRFDLAGFFFFYIYVLFAPSSLLLLGESFHMISSYLPSSLMHHPPSPPFHNPHCRLLLLSKKKSSATAVAATGRAAWLFLAGDPSQRFFGKTLPRFPRKSQQKYFL